MPRFEVNQVNNPNGRPKGSGHRQQVFNQLVMPHRDALVEKAISMAKEGNPHILKVFLERILPPKPTHEHVLLDMNQSNLECLSEVGKEIILAVINGEIDPEKGRALSALLEGQRKLVEHTELKSKLEDIENKFNNV